MPSGISAKLTHWTGACQSRYKMYNKSNITNNKSHLVPSQDEFVRIWAGHFSPVHPSAHLCREKKNNESQQKSLCAPSGAAVTLICVVRNGNACRCCQVLRLITLYPDYASPAAHPGCIGVSQEPANVKCYSSEGLSGQKTQCSESQLMFSFLTRTRFL